VHVNRLVRSARWMCVVVLILLLITWAISTVCSVGYALKLDNGRVCGVIGSGYVLFRIDQIGCWTSGPRSLYDREKQLQWDLADELTSFETRSFSRWFPGNIGLGWPIYTSLVQPRCADYPQNTTSSHELYLPLWMLALPTLSMTMLSFLALRPKSQISHTTCAKCSYNLIGNQSGACPECGTTIPPEQLERIRIAIATEQFNDVSSEPRAPDKIA
jgi:hypothetical protein